MTKFSVELSRRFVQSESAIVVVEAKSKAEARRIALDMSADDGVSYEASDSDYDHYSVEEITKVG